MYKLHAVLYEKQSRSWRFLNLRHKGSLKGGQIVWRRFVGLQEQIWVGTLDEWRVRSYTSLTTNKQTLVRSGIVIRVRSERFLEILTASKQTNFIHNSKDMWKKRTSTMSLHKTTRISYSRGGGGVDSLQQERGIRSVNEMRIGSSSLRSIGWHVMSASVARHIRSSPCCLFRRAAKKHCKIIL